MKSLYDAIIIYGTSLVTIWNIKKGQTKKGQTSISSVFNRWNHDTLNYHWYEGYQFQEKQGLTEKVSHVELKFTEITNINDGITSNTLHLNKHNHARRYRN